MTLERTRGHAAVSFTPQGGLGRLFQKGSAKAMLPRTHAATPEVVFLNTAGGLTGGDRMVFELDTGAGAYVTATTQTAERAYASVTGTADVTVRLSVGPGARLDWLPQETILFDRAALRRRTEIDLAEGASCLFAETLTLGRAAMGETVTRLDLFDRRSVTRVGRPVYIDPLRLTDADLASGSPAGLSGARALTSIVYVGADAEDRLPGLRRAFPTVTASAWDEKLVIRAMSPDPTMLRAEVAALLEYLRSAPLPRVWQI